MSMSELTKLPYFAWDCITLHIRNKGDVHLVINNQDAMSYFLKFLIYALETLDGDRGTGMECIQLKKKEMKDKLGTSNRKFTYGA